MIYFHANGEDIGSSYPLIETLKNKLSLDVIAPEYPGYGIYQNNDEKDEKFVCSAEQMKEDAECIFDFAVKNIEGLRETDIIIFGRSVGSGPCVHLAVTRNPGAMILVSPFKNLKSVVYENFFVLSALV